MDKLFLVALIVAVLSMDRTLLGAYFFDRAFFVSLLLSFIFGDAVVSFGEIQIFGFSSLKLSIAVALMWDLLWITRFPLGGIVQPKVVLPAAFSFCFSMAFAPAVNSSVLGFSFVPGLLIAYALGGLEDLVFALVEKLSNRTFMNASMGKEGIGEKFERLWSVFLPVIFVILRFALIFALAVASLSLIPYLGTAYSALPEQLKVFFALVFPSVVVFSAGRLMFYILKTRIAL